MSGQRVTNISRERAREFYISFTLFRALNRLLETYTPEDRLTATRKRDVGYHNKISCYIIQSAQRGGEVL